MGKLSEFRAAFRNTGRNLFMMVLLIGVCLFSMGRFQVVVADPLVNAASESCNPLPFVLTTEILFGSFGKAQPNGCYPVQQASRFDLLITGADKHSSSRWCERPSNAFQTIKTLNPRTKIMLFRMGPGQYVTAYWGAIGDGWDWIKQNHGKGATDRWTALGVFSNDYLLSLAYPVERAMEIGNPNWQEYWMRRNFEDIWVNFINNMKGTYTDGLIADGMQYGVSWSNRWCAESSYNNGVCSQLDHPQTYYQNGAYNQDLWRQHYHQFLERAVPYFRERNLEFGVNAWRIAYPAQHELYERLRITALEECGFLCTGSIQLDTWEKKLRTLQNANSYAIVSMNLPPGYKIILPKQWNRVSAQREFVKVGGNGYGTA
ncbi:MAG: hypothetical protein ANABAC_2145 [Anaerolineae bacterium]|nr:MAG: hypothetical protein ANABAC_2145 [Anaerolineae bacterium]